MSIRRQLRRTMQAATQCVQRGNSMGWIPLLIGSLLLAVWSLTFHMIAAERATAERDAQNAARDLSGIYGALMVRALDQIDLALGMLRFASERQAPQDALRELQEGVLVPSALLFAIEISDATGKVVASNQAGSYQNVAKRDYFRAFQHSMGEGDHLYVGVNGDEAGHMVFARKLMSANGRFDGVVSLIVGPDYFTSWYDRGRLGEHGVLGLADASGRLIATQTDDKVAWSDPAQSDPDRLVDLNRTAGSVYVHPWDGVRRYTVTEKLPRYPFITLVGLAVDEQVAMYEADRRARLLQAAALSAMLLVFGALLWWMARRQARVRLAQATYHAASQASADAHVILHRVADSRGKVHDFLITDVNPRMIELTGVPRGEFVGQLLSHVVPEWRGTVLYTAFLEAVRSGVPSEHEWHNHDPRLHAQWIHAQLVPTLDGIVVLLRDISERKRAEQELLRHNAELTTLNQELSTLNHELTQAQEQLVQSEKLASIGLLAAGVAHEINNPVGFVMSNISMLDRYIGSLFTLIERYRQSESALEDSAVRADIQRLRDEVEIDYLRDDIPALMKETQDGITRVRKIVQDLKNFSRVDSQQEWQAVNLHDGIDSTLNVVNNEIKYKAEVIKEYGSLPLIECRLSEINQVIMNLVINASHAIKTDERGRITIRTGSTEQEAWFEVEDTGCGIAPDNLARIFDPFFTTKPVGKGTGLGLSLSYGIVKKHQGRIEVRSEVDQGTCFRVTLPLHQVEVAAVDGNTVAEVFT